MLPEIQIKKWREQVLTESELKQAQLQMAEMPDFVLSPWFQGLVMLLTVFLIGMIINLVSSLALKNSKNSVIDTN